MLGVRRDDELVTRGDFDLSNVGHALGVHIQADGTKKLTSAPSFIKPVRISGPFYPSQREISDPAACYSGRGATNGIEGDSDWSSLGLCGDNVIGKGPR